MGAEFASKLALTVVAAMGLYAPTMGLPLPLSSCLRTVGVASAAPSPTCGSDLRECLRASAKTGLYGVRYVTADDVARCMEAFNACTHGSAGRGGTARPPNSTAAESSTGRGLPNALSIETAEDHYDCTVNGTAFGCSSTKTRLQAGLQYWRGQVTGTLSGLTMTGTYSQESYGHNTIDPGCLASNTWSGPVVFAFSPDGTVEMKWGPVRWEQTLSGTCTGAGGDTLAASAWTAKWSARG